MTPHTTFTGTPDDLKAMLTEVVKPLVDRIRELELLAGHRKVAYTVAEVAEQIGYHSNTVLGFIHDGRMARNGRKIKLIAKEPTKGQYRILPADLDSWLTNF